MSPRPQVPGGEAPHKQDVAPVREPGDEGRTWTLQGVVDDVRAFWIFLDESPPLSNGERVKVVPASELRVLRDALREISHVEFRSTEEMQQFAREALSTPREDPGMKHPSKEAIEAGCDCSECAS